MTEIRTLDCTDFEVPQPMIKTKEMLDTLQTGELLKVIVSSEGSIRNLRTLINSQAYELVSLEHEGAKATFLIKK